MRSSTLLAAAIAATLSLGGCSLFGSDDEEEGAAAEQVTPASTLAPVESVRDIEIGRTRSGFAITAYGTAPGLGYGKPELRPRRQGAPGPDGFLDYDFIAQAPDPRFELGIGTVQARTIRADLHVLTRELQGARGIRIHGVSGGLVMNF